MVTGNNQYYSTPESRRDAIIGKSDVLWDNIKQVNSDYLDVIENTDVYISFRDYLVDEFGIQVDTDEDNNMLLTYVIVDSQKHLVFLLKYAS